jgi:hypothetical protein
MRAARVVGGVRDDGGMKNAEPRSIIMNVLDRAAATSGPFWEPPPEERQKIADLLGTPSVRAQATETSGGAAWSGGTAGLFLGLAILNEVAVELIAQHAGGTVGREDAIFQIRERVADLLADEGD